MKSMLLVYHLLVHSSHFLDLLYHIAMASIQAAADTESVFHPVSMELGIQSRVLTFMGFNWAGLPSNTSKCDKALSSTREFLASWSAGTDISMGEGVERYAITVYIPGVVGLVNAYNTKIQVWGMIGANDGGWSLNREIVFKMPKDDCCSTIFSVRVIVRKVVSISVVIQGFTRIGGFPQDSYYTVSSVWTVPMYYLRSELFALLPAHSGSLLVRMCWDFGAANIFASVDWLSLGSYMPGIVILVRDLSLLANIEWNGFSVGKYEEHQSKLGCLRVHAFRFGCPVWSYEQLHVPLSRLSTVNSQQLQYSFIRPQFFLDFLQSYVPLRRRVSAAVYIPVMGILLTFDHSNCLSEVPENNVIMHHISIAWGSRCSVFFDSVIAIVCVPLSLSSLIVTWIPKKNMYFLPILPGLDIAIWMDVHVLWQIAWGSRLRLPFLSVYSLDFHTCKFICWGEKQSHDARFVQFHIKDEEKLCNNSSKVVESIQGISSSLLHSWCYESGIQWVFSLCDMIRHPVGVLSVRSGDSQGLPMVSMVLTSIISFDPSTVLGLLMTFWCLDPFLEQILIRSSQDIRFIWLDCYKEATYLAIILSDVDMENTVRNYGYTAALDCSNHGLQGHLIVIADQCPPIMVVIAGITSVIDIGAYDLRLLYTSVDFMMSTVKLAEITEMLTGIPTELRLSACNGHKCEYWTVSQEDFVVLVTKFGCTNSEEASPTYWLLNGGDIYVCSMWDNCSCLAEGSLRNLRSAMNSQWPCRVVSLIMTTSQLILPDIKHSQVDVYTIKLNCWILLSWVWHSLFSVAGGNLLAYIWRIACRCLIQMHVILSAACCWWYLTLILHLILEDKDRLKGKGMSQQLWDLGFLVGIGHYLSTILSEYD